MRRVLVLAVLALALCLSVERVAQASESTTYSYFCSETGAQLTIAGGAGEAYVVRSATGVVLATGVAGSDEWYVPVAPGAYQGVWVSLGGQNTWVLNSERDAYWE